MDRFQLKEHQPLALTSKLDSSTFGPPPGDAEADTAVEAAKENVNDSPDHITQIPSEIAHGQSPTAQLSAAAPTFCQVRELDVRRICDKSLTKHASIDKATGLCDDIDCRFDHICRPFWLSAAGKVVSPCHHGSFGIRHAMDGNPSKQVIHVFPTCKSYGNCKYGPTCKNGAHDWEYLRKAAQGRLHQYEAQPTVWLGVSV
ncbi:unnamed protein product [Zymoseptoria tritici ST99CH_3D7]|uniref:C3H1-type domain-containing protein n=1 Tax=Zymoseptoria tritici (strain ST99CH_3D7) TaxID=1276538 RepID=A0A1X7RVD9_ZYMT9|nr:unnamed protein product [Zymoseptoria tritici ST99CH_3D7]